MRKKYLRSSFSVEAEKYEPGKNMEDGFEPWTKVRYSRLDHYRRTRKTGT